MNLANLALTGLQVAQNRMQTAGHNINNAATDGYNRQSVVAASASAKNTGSGWVGMGVEGVTVNRAYDQFLARQLLGAQMGGAALNAYQNEITQINNLFADRTVGISPALQQFFDGLQAVASSPADPAARQELMGRAASLVGQINDANAFLEAQRSNINTQITTAVEQVNSQLHRINELNQQIVTARATSGHQPNDLLDQRDQLLTELGQLIDVTVLDQNGTINLTIGNGQVLLGGGSVFPLHAVPSAQDPSRMVLAYSAPDGAGQFTALELREDAVSGGSLGGLLRYRQEALDTVQNDLGRLAAGLTLAINQQHEAGFDINGNPGQPFFELGNPKVLAGVGNQGTVQLQAAFDLPGSGDPIALTGHDYRITFDGSQYTVFNISTQSVAAQSVDLPLVIEGVQLSVSGSPQAGDSWVVQPVRTAAGSFSLALERADQIAAASTPAGDADGGNALALAQMQTGKPMAGGTASFNELFSQTVNRVGVLTQQNATASKAQNALIQQNFAAQQAVSGVNIDEELVLLERSQEQFRAAARLIDVSASLFDTLLSIGR